MSRIVWVVGQWRASRPKEGASKTPENWHLIGVWDTQEDAEAQCVGLPGAFMSRVPMNTIKVGTHGGYDPTDGSGIVPEGM